MEEYRDGNETGGNGEVIDKVYSAPSDTKSRMVPEEEQNSETQQNSGINKCVLPQNKNKRTMESHPESTHPFEDNENLTEQKGII